MWVSGWRDDIGVGDNLSYACDLRLGSLLVLRIALALHACLGSLSSIVRIHCALISPNKELRWSGVVCMAWGFLLTLPIFAVIDLTSVTE